MSGAGSVFLYLGVLLHTLKTHEGMSAHRMTNNLKNVYWYVYAPFVRTLS